MRILEEKSAKDKELVISLGGSVITKDNYSNVDKILSQLLTLSRKYHLFVVTGGGTLARNLIEIVKNKNNMSYKKYYTPKKIESMKEYILDEIGIAATHLHAKLFAALLGYKKYPVPPQIKNAINLRNHYRIVFMGGTLPGRSTDTVAAELAAKVKAECLINVSDIKGVYDKDPDKHKDAKLLRKISYEELWKIIKHYPQSPGEYKLFDHKALEIVKKHRIPVKFVHFEDISNFDDDNIGTLVCNS